MYTLLPKQTVQHRPQPLRQPLHIPLLHPRQIRRREPQRQHLGGAGLGLDLVHNPRELLVGDLGKEDDGARRQLVVQVAVPVAAQIAGSL